MVNKPPPFLPVHPLIDEVYSSLAGKDIYKFSFLKILIV